MAKSKTQQIKETMCTVCDYRERVCGKLGVACHTAMEAGYKPSMMHKFKKTKKTDKK